MPLSPNTSSQRLRPPVNERYCYTPKQLVAFLENKIRTGLSINLHKTEKSLGFGYLTTDGIKSEIQEIIGGLAAKHLDASLNLLKVAEDHWVGVLLEFKNNLVVKCQVIRSSFYDAVERRALERSAFEKIEEAVKEIQASRHEEISFYLSTKLTTDEGNTSALYAIQNLYRVFFDLNYHTPINVPALRALYAELLSDMDPTIAPKLYVPPMSYAEAGILKPNTKYEYSYSATKLILDCRVKMELADTPQLFKHRVITAPIVRVGTNNSQFNPINLINEETEPCTVLVPCYVDSTTSEYSKTYWVGLLIEINAEKQITKIITTNSYLPMARYVDGDMKSFLNEIKRAHSNCIIQKYEACIKSPETFDTSMLMIENLLSLAKHRRTADQSTEIPRRKDLMALRRYNEEYFDEFYGNQLKGIRVNDSPEAQISEQFIQLFKSLAVMHHNSKQAFANNIEREPTITQEEIDRDYKVIFDEASGRIKLQLANIKSDSAKTILNIKSFENHKKEIAAQYGKRIGAGLIIGGVGVGGGAGVGAIVLATTAEAAVAGEAVAFGVFIAANPLFLIIPGVVLGVLSTSSLIGRHYFSRDFLLTVQKAYNLYDEACLADIEERKQIQNQAVNEESGAAQQNSVAENTTDPRFKEAIDLIEQQFNGKPFILQGFRYLSTNNYQRYFSILLLAQIKARLKDDDCVWNYAEVHNYAHDKDLKAMALVGLVKSLYEKNWEMKTFKTQEQKTKAIEKYTGMLQKDHKEFLQFYFDKVWHAFELLLSIMENPHYLRSEEGFKTVEKQIDAIIHYQDLCFLKHMQQNGPFAEIVFSFAQGMAYAVTAQHYGYMKATSSNCPRESSNLTEAAALFTRVKELIAADTIGLSNGDASKDLIENMSKYADKFLDNHAKQTQTLHAKANAAQNEHLKTVSGNAPQEKTDKPTDQPGRPLTPMKDLQDERHTMLSEAEFGAAQDKTFRNDPTTTSKDHQFTEKSKYKNQAQ